MSDIANPRYGTPNWDLIKSWFQVSPEDDGEFWAINLMKYRPMADYSDGRETNLTGEQADDEYVPIEIFEELGAVLAIGARVKAQRAGDPQWDRIAIVRYPSRAAFFDMQRRPDFIEAHAHKDAGMEFTIVVGSDARALPAETPSAEAGELVMTFRNLEESSGPAPEAEGTAPIASFDVEGVMIGDDRIWHEVRFDRIPSSAIETHVSGFAGEQIVVVLDVPLIDSLVESISSRS